MASWMSCRWVRYASNSVLAHLGPALIVRLEPHNSAGRLCGGPSSHNMLVAIHLNQHGCWKACCLQLSPLGGGAQHFSFHITKSPPAPPAPGQRLGQWGLQCFGESASGQPRDTIPGAGERKKARQEGRHQASRLQRFCLSVPLSCGLCKQCCCSLFLICIRPGDECTQTQTRVTFVRVSHPSFAFPTLFKKETPPHPLIFTCTA